MKRPGLAGLVLSLFCCVAWPAGPAHVDITWMSIANLYIEAGPVKAVFDGYITRLPQSAFRGGGGGYAYTTRPFKPDVAAVSRVLDALGGPRAVNLLLTGHSHWDHSFDTATWSRLSGAPVIGSRTTCFQVRAENIPAERCTPVEGGETFRLADGVTMHVIRWNHSGDPAVNWEQHDPVELDGVPRPDPGTGGLRPGVAEDFPNGGGNRALLFVFDGPRGRYSLFVQNSASPIDLHMPIVVDGVNYGAPLDNLQKAIEQSGLARVDLWIGTGGRPIAESVVPIIRPRAYIPIHWDGLWEPFEAGLPWAFNDTALETYLGQQGVRLLKPGQYMDKWRLSALGTQPAPNAQIKRALGFSEVQSFDRR
ncbi:MAG TPA: MBL fold metallo-hydrolase [Burkholderiales bacterium]|nr:MBL fold metallo-hydrolase [Burkholderiales bacterium]